MTFSYNEQQIRLVLPHRPPFLMVDQIDSCTSQLNALCAYKLVSGADQMLARVPRSRSALAPALVTETFAQAAGFLMKLRWLEEHGADIRAFSCGQLDEVRAAFIPASVLAETRAKYYAAVPVGDALRVDIALMLQRGWTLRFKGNAFAGERHCAAFEMQLVFPDYMLSPHLQH